VNWLWLTLLLADYCVKLDDGLGLFMNAEVLFDGGDALPKSIVFFRRSAARFAAIELAFDVNKFFQGFCRAHTRYARLWAKTFSSSFATRSYERLYGELMDL
jgi:hypothetical protein